MKSDNKLYTLITGASEGFGKALAIECARRGMNLILVALPGPELSLLAGFIRRHYSVDVIYVEKDLSKENSCMDLFNEINALRLKVNMLINNAGIGSSLLFAEGNLSLYEKQIKVNVLATTLITRLFLDTLERNSPSYILNIGSLASFFYLPKKQVYGATKSYIYYFSKSLRKEVEKDRISVSVLCPGGMNTSVALTFLNKTGTFFSRISIMNPEEVAPIAVNGLLNGKEVIIPGRLNRFFMLLDKILPEKIKKMITGSTMKKIDASSPWVHYLPGTIQPYHPPRAVA